MKTIIVVDKASDWPLDAPDTIVVPARTYIADTNFTQSRGFRVVNMCRSYRYQSLGYYVSLLAEARGHKPLPSISTIQDMKSLTIIRYASEELEELMQKSLKGLQSTEFVLSVYFGSNMAKRYDRLSAHLFSLFRAPLLRATFIRDPDGAWDIKNIKPISANEVSTEHKAFAIEAAIEYFTEGAGARRKTPDTRYDIAILYNTIDDSKPSNERAIKKFVKAGEALNLGVEVIGRDDYGRLGEFDALFIRETTNVNHHTFRFARRAQAEGLEVIDDPESILKCANKVFLAELLARYKIPIPQTLIISRDNVALAEEKLGFPLIIKQPDSYFSKGVFKASDSAECRQILDKLFEKSEFVIAQEFLPTDYDWRVGVLNGEPIFVCKYFMAAKHWQIVKRSEDGKRSFGEVRSFAVAEAPKHVVNTAVRAANLIGNGLYGVDIKEVNRKSYVIEINDNPNIDSGYEDMILKDGLYRRIMEVFLQRIERRKGAKSKK